MRRAHIIFAIAVYCTGSVAAFGHSAANTYERLSLEYADCRKDPKNICIDDRTGRAATGGLLAAMMWPLYLSWELFQ